MMAECPVVVHPKTKTHRTSNIILDGPKVLIFAASVDFKP